MATKWQKIRIPFPKRINDVGERLEIGDLIVERIVERTDQGVGFREKTKREFDFPKYSEAYKASLDFKNAGKPRKVNLQLSGDMLAALKVLKHSADWVEVGFENGTEENGKADGNIRGTYGTDTPNSEKARPFLGISNKDLVRIIKYVTSD